MSNSNLLVSRKSLSLAFPVLWCAIAALLLVACGPSENAGPTTNSPSPEATRAASNVAPSASEYSIGDKIDFGTNGNSQSYKVSGWSGAEPNFSWTEGIVSVLALRISPVADPLTLKIKCGGFTRNPEVLSQPVEVFANDQKIADWNVRELAEYSAPIPPAISQSGGVLTITLKIPKAVSPKSLGAGQDSRLLGLSCLEVSLSRTQ
ncbi:MAG: hypothetical protein QOJ45_1261 [Verrucomicrobiota bacterium]|jgi:hypothetical protein